MDDSAMTIGMQIQAKEARMAIVCENPACENYGRSTDLIPPWKQPAQHIIKNGVNTPGEPLFNSPCTECCGSFDWKRKEI